MAAVWKRREGRPQPRLAVMRGEVAPSSRCFHAGWPVSEVAGKGSERGAREKVDASFEALVGKPLGDHGDQSAAARAGIDRLELYQFCQDRAVRPGAHERSGRPIDVVE